MLKLYKNGVIIQKKDENEKGYYGIDGLQKEFTYSYYINVYKPKN